MKDSWEGSQRKWYTVWKQYVTQHPRPNSNHNICTETSNQKIHDCIQSIIGYEPSDSAIERINIIIAFMQQPAIQQDTFGHLCYISTSFPFPINPSPNVAVDDERHEALVQLQDRMCNPVTFHAKLMVDIMHCQKALKQPDPWSFVQAIVKEVNGPFTNNIGNWSRIIMYPKTWKLCISTENTLHNLDHKEIAVCYKEINHYLWHFIQWWLKIVDFVIAHTKSSIIMFVYMELAADIETKHGPASQNF